MMKIVKYIEHNDVDDDDDTSDVLNLTFIQKTNEKGVVITIMKIEQM